MFDIILLELSKNISIICVNYNLPNYLYIVLIMNDDILEFDLYNNFALLLNNIYR